MAIRGMSIIGLEPPAPRRAAATTLPPAANVRKDVFLSALLEMPTTKRSHRSPFEWAGAAALHIALIAALIIVPLYTTGTIRLSDYNDVPLVAPPPPAPPAPSAPAVRPPAPRTVNTHARLTYKLPKAVAPNSIPKKISSEDGSAAPDLGSVAGGVPGGVDGGLTGGAIGGVPGGTAPPPPLAPQPARTTPRIVRVGSKLKAPRQTFSVQPEYPPLARQAHISGTVVVDAIIDERGNVVQAHVVSGHPLLVPAALRAVLQWKYEPTSLNGQPISVELEVVVNFSGAKTQQ